MINGIATLSAAFYYYKKKFVDFELSFPLILSSALGAPLGSLLSARADVKYILWVLVFAVAFGGIRMLTSKKIEERAEKIDRKKKIILSLIIGFGIGVIAGFTGVGGGIFVVPMLIYILKTPTKIAVASCSFIVVFSSFSGFLTHYSLGFFDASFAFPLVLAAIIGGQIGSRITVTKLKASNIKRMFGIILLLFALKLLQKVI